MGTSATQVAHRSEENTMSNLTIRDSITVEAETKALDLNHLIMLEKALDLLGVPWVKGIRITAVIESDGVYFNSAPGVNLVSVTRTGVTMPTILDTRFGIDLSEDLFSEYNYDEIFVRVMDSAGPTCASMGVAMLKELAESV